MPATGTGQATGDPSEADIALIGVPFDGGVTHRSGARHGPRAVREQSTLLRRYNAATGVAPFAHARVRDLGDCWLEFPYELSGALAEITGYILLVLFGLSRLGAFVLSKVKDEEDAYFVVMLSIMAVAGFLADAIQLPGIVGAFLAGLAVG